MDFEQSREYLSNALSFGIRLGLHRMNRLAELLGHPESQLRCIHIAGTNGKGSVSAYCASILAAAGRRVGVFTSPYLVRLTERIRVIDGREGLDALRKDEAAGEIPPDRFAGAMTIVRQAVEQMIVEEYEHPTEFELLTAAAFLHFAAVGCDVVVLETGLGGRLDSTNIISDPLASVITALGYDHTDRLGKTMGEIAAEKAGIIKQGSVYLSDPRDLGLLPDEAEAALTAVRRRCAEQGAVLNLVSQNEIETLEYGWEGQTFRDKTSGQVYRTRLLGLYQPSNAVLAARVCLGIGLALPEAIAQGIEIARWPARMELVRHAPLTLIDGAHNVQGCQALAATLARLLAGRSIIYLAGMLQDKDYNGMLRAVLENPGCHPAAFICVQPDNPRALHADVLAERVRDVVERLHNKPSSGYNIKDAIHSAVSPQTGASLALRLAEETGSAICAFGSLYLVGTLRSMLEAREEQRWTGTS